jgi:hypothetical protein
MTDDSLADVQPYTAQPAVAAAYDYVEGLHLLMIAVIHDDDAGFRTAMDATVDAANRLAFYSVSARADAR